MKRIPPWLQWFVLALAMLLPFLVIRIFSTFHHVHDLSVFRAWAEAWDLGWRNIYLNCESCNYPILGTMFSGGLFNSIDFKNSLRVINRFRYYLAVIDALNVLVICFILMRLKIEHAPFWAGLIGLLPSSWIGASVWGQIDGFGQFFILLFFTLLIIFNATPRSKMLYFMFLAIAGLLISAMLLTKQLIYFSVLGIGVILLANILVYSSKIRDIVSSLLLVSLFTLLPILLIDSVIQIPMPYTSHIYYILVTGSQHGDIVSSLGFNIWSLFSSDVLGSSRLPLQIGAWSLSIISPYSAGVILFLLLSGLMTYFYVRDVLHHRIPEIRHFDRSQVLSSCMYLAMINLAFNVALTGTHERYLFHAFQLILVVCLGWRLRTSLIVSITGAMLYGMFLYGYLGGFIHREDQLIVQVATALYLLLFIYLTLLWGKKPDPQVFYPNRS